MVYTYIHVGGSFTCASFPLTTALQSLYYSNKHGYTIWNMDGLYFDWGMSAGHIIDWRTSAKIATFFGLEINVSATVKTM